MPSHMIVIKKTELNNLHEFKTIHKQFVKIVVIGFGIWYNVR